MHDENINSEIGRLLSGLYHPALKAIDPGLERVVAFLELLGAPHKRLPPVIHVAGTNGKGSVIANLQSIFTTAGYKVHCYTSPHLVRFNERIVINSEPISNAYLLELLHTVYQHIPYQPVTFFEATTAMTFLAFAQHPADIVLLETGMGGRLDATNVIETPLLTAITPIGLDHCEYLGDTIAAIAGEKAGIIKRSVPCIVGRQETSAAQVMSEKAKTLNTPLYRYGQEWEVAGNEYRSSKRTLTITPGLAGMHQIDNAATAIACCDLLPQFSLIERHIAQGILQAIWPARLQPLTTGRYASLLPAGISLWLDGGHNPHGAVALANWFASQQAEIHVICGMVKGKDTAEFLRILAPHVSSLVAVAIPNEPLSQSAEQIASIAAQLSIAAHAATSIENALQILSKHAKTPAIICICGSLYLAGKVLATN